MLLPCLLGAFYPALFAAKLPRLSEPLAGSDERKLAWPAAAVVAKLTKWSIPTLSG